MHFAIHLLDRPNSAEPRAKFLNEHLAFVEANLERIQVAGPLRDETGQTQGSLYVVAAADQADALNFVSSDPYFDAGVWSNPVVHEFMGVAGDWVGGKNW